MPVWATGTTMRTDTDSSPALVAPG